MLHTARGRLHCDCVLTNMFMNLFSVHSKLSPLFPPHLLPRIFLLLSFLSPSLTSSLPPSPPIPSSLLSLSHFLSSSLPLLLAVWPESGALYPNSGHGELELPATLLLAWCVCCVGRYLSSTSAADVRCVRTSRALLSSLALLYCTGIRFFQEVRTHWSGLVCR